LREWKVPQTHENRLWSKEEQGTEENPYPVRSMAFEPCDPDPEQTFARSRSPHGFRDGKEEDEKESLEQAGKVFSKIDSEETEGGDQQIDEKRVIDQVSPKAH
jgi:hypothetical protein